MREVGLRLLVLSEFYEGGLVAADAAGGRAASIAGLVARQRRFVRAAHRLLDAGDRLEAQVLIRSQIEFLIVQKWLQLDPDLHFPMWFIKDARSRIALHDHVVRTDGIAVIEEDVLARYRNARQNKTAELDAICAQRGIPIPRYPTLEQQARAVELETVYALAYRFDSQSAAHPQALAIEQLLEPVPEGIIIRGEPPVDRRYADGYAVTAICLHDALASAAAHYDDLAIHELAQIAEQIRGLRNR